MSAHPATRQHVAGPCQAPARGTRSAVAGVAAGRRASRVPGRASARAEGRNAWSPQAAGAVRMNAHPTTGSNSQPATSRERERPIFRVILMDCQAIDEKAKLSYGSSTKLSEPLKGAIMDIDVGTLTVFPSLKPDGPHQRNWTFKNETDETWTDIWISTRPQAWHGFFTDPFGGRGNPPNMDTIVMRWDNKNFRGTFLNNEDFHNDLDPPISKGEELYVSIEFSDGFEEFEYIQFTFSRTEIERDEEGQIIDRREGIPIEGSRVIGRDLPSSDAGPVGGAIESGIGAGLGLIGKANSSADSPESPLAIVALGREVQRLRQQITQVQSRLETQRQTIIALQELAKRNQG
jgi:hypothetical protein